MGADSSQKPVVSLSGIEKSYGKQHVLGPVEFSVRPGECVLLRGRNGAGKSTLLSILAGVIPFDAGERRLDEAARHLVSLVPQELSLYEALSCGENLKFWGLAAGLPPRAIRARSRWLLRELGLEDKAREPAGACSGGMKRRLHLATALMDTPRLLLLDEPTVGADEQSAELILRMLERFKSQGTAVVMVTHVERDLAIADRVITLEAGLIAGEESR